jgi:putative acetyltransferase
VPTAEPRLRSMRLADYPGVMALWKKTEGIGLNESDSRPAIAAFLKHNPGLSTVAVADGRVVGAILCGHDGRRGYLHHLAVAPKSRRQGLGRALVGRSLENLRAVGIPKCNLFLFSDNTAGRAFWKRLGWTLRSDLLLVQKSTAPERKTAKTRSC